MNPIELLKTGIEQGEWGPVCQAYKTLTGQTIFPPENMESVYAEFYKNVSALLNSGGENQTRESVLSEPSEVVTPTVSEAPVKQDTVKQGKKRGRPKKEKATEGDEPTDVQGAIPVVGIPSTMTFITNGLYDAAEAQKWDAVAKKTKVNMPSRKAHKPIYLGCPKCNYQVDITKSHVHVGTVMADSDRKRDESKIKCPKCKIQFIVADGNRISTTPFPKE